MLDLDLTRWRWVVRGLLAKTLDREPHPVVLGFGTTAGTTNPLRQIDEVHVYGIIAGAGKVVQIVEVDLTPIKFEVGLNGLDELLGPATLSGEPCGDFLDERVVRHTLGP